MAVSASRTSSSLNGLMIAITIFMVAAPAGFGSRAAVEALAKRVPPKSGVPSRAASMVPTRTRSWLYRGRVARKAGKCLLGRLSEVAHHALLGNRGDEPA